MLFLVTRSTPYARKYIQSLVYLPKYQNWDRHFLEKIDDPFHDGQKDGDHPLSFGEQHLCTPNREESETKDDSEAALVDG